MVKKDWKDKKYKFSGASKPKGLNRIANKNVLNSLYTNRF
jgi:hypothetical protein